MCLKELVERTRIKLLKIIMDFKRNITADDLKNTKRPGFNTQYVSGD